MKNLLLLSSFVITLLFTGQSVNAQDCAIESVKVSADTNCVFTTWIEGYDIIARNSINLIKVNGVEYVRNDTSTTGATIRYSRVLSDTLIIDDSVVIVDSIANCDTAGSFDLFGQVIYPLFGNLIDTCEFRGGTSLPICPDNVLVSQGVNCLLFQYESGIFSAPADSVVLNDSVYYKQPVDFSDPSLVIYLRDTNTACDTSNMTELLSDTLFLGQKVCTYESGILPIVILAFDYTSQDGRVDLSWKVDSDEPVQRLYLQKSYDGVRWSNIHNQAMELPGSGFATTGQYTDMKVDQSRVYYRLFIEGYQGRGNYSNVLPVTLKDQVINQVFYQPQSRSIMVRAGKNFAGEMYLFNTHGQNIMTRDVLLAKGGYVEVQVEGALPAGIYFVRFEDSQIPPVKLFID